MQNIMVRVVCLLLLAASALWGKARTLRVYFIDVEGGQATLVMSPSGESMLFDAGWPGWNDRDAKRIERAVQAAGAKQIDYMVVTHYHLDHVGGVPPLAARIPIRRFVDHGPTIESGPDADKLYQAYLLVRAKGEHILAKTGDRIPIQGIDVLVVASAGQLISEPLLGAGQPNPHCAGTQLRDQDPTENAQSIGVIVRYGKFRLANLADLTWDKELELACPTNRLGTVDVYVTTHHGMNLSGAPAMVHGLRPRVAIMNNGPAKGGTPEAWQAIRSAPGLEDIWQLHYALVAGEQNNAPEEFIANLEEKCDGYWLKLVAEPDGSFTITNERNQKTKRYPAASK